MEIQNTEKDDREKLDPFGLKASDALFANIKKQTEENKKHFWRNLPAFAWQVTKSLIGLFLMLGVFTVASSRFETVSLAIIMAIYIAIDEFFTMWVYANARTTFALANDIFSLKTLMQPNYKINENQREESTGTLKKLGGIAVIKSVTYFVFSAIILFNIISNFQIKM